MGKKLTIHFFVNYTTKSGTFFRFHNLALGMRELGHTIRIYGASYMKGENDRLEIIDGIEYHITACYFPLQSVFGQTPHPYGGIKRLFKKYPECDVAHVFQPFLSAYIPWYFNKKKAKQNIYDWDDLWTDGLSKSGKKIIDKWLYQQVKFVENKGPKTSDYTTTCGKFLADRALLKGAPKTELVYNGFWEYTPNTQEVSRDKMGLDKSAFYMGFMGRTSHVSEMKSCFELLKTASQTIPNIRLALCGMPKEVLEGADEQILNRIDYLGYLKPIETRDFASSLDIGLLPLEDNDFNQSRFPIKFAEYLAANIPVLCSDVGECAIIAQKFPFIKIAGRNNEAWIESGVDVLTKINTREWPAVNREQIMETLSWKAISQKMLNLYFENDK